MSDSSSLLIDPSRLAEPLAEARGRFHVVALAECASTNTVLLRLAEDGAPSGTVVVTDRQTAGRGSRGRTWMASPESSLTFSVLWAFPGGLERLSGLSLAVGVAVVQALGHCGAAGVQLKWPNDVLYGHAKLGGILVELHADEQGAKAVIGIGLNLRLPESIGAPSVAALPAAALEQIVADLPERHLLFSHLLRALAETFDRFVSGGFAAVRADWHACHAWQDRPVRLLREGRVDKEGVCEGADLDGALLVRTVEGIERCLSGDVSLRPL